MREGWPVKLDMGGGTANSLTTASLTDGEQSGLGTQPTEPACLREKQGGAGASVQQAGFTNTSAAPTAPPAKAAGTPGKSTTHCGAVFLALG